METRLRAARVDDAEALAALYNPYVLDSIATFEEETVAVATMAERVSSVLGAGLPWWVAECPASNTLQGYAYAGAWKPRSAYRCTVEMSVYLAEGATGQGLGKRLATTLLEALGEGGVHAVLAGISLPNPASVALHESLGFEKVGQLREVGRKFDRWIDVGYWQRLL